MMRDENSTTDFIVDTIIYTGINACLICAIVAILTCGFTIITIAFLWYKKRRTNIFEFRPKNVFISSSEEREVPRSGGKSLFNRTPLNLEAVCFDSSSDMEYFSLDGDDSDGKESLNITCHECKTVSFYNGVKCHSTPNRTNQDTDLSLPFTYVKNPIYIL